MKKMSEWLEANRSLFIDLIRVYIGLILIQKGYYFYSDPDVLIKMLELSNAPLAGFVLGHYITIAHFFGGVLLVIGFLTRIVILFQLPILMGAVKYIHYSEGMFAIGSNLAYANVILFLLVIFLLYGGGRYSADYYIENRKYS